jgi:hypothetical protein
MTGINREPPADRLAYSVDEAAAVTGLSRDLLYNQMRREARLPQGRLQAHHHPSASGGLPSQCRVVNSARRHASQRSRPWATRSTSWSPRG